MTVVHEFSRALVWDAASAWNSRLERAREAALLCKAHVGQQAVEISRRCVELMGATGFAWEEDHHLWLKRAQMDGMLLGASMEIRALLAESRGWHADVPRRDERSELPPEPTES
jgi:alkylation response protein AidB-like acyl-CoA dehydrogenase